ncbi:MAG: phenylacetate-CoA oxygenase subunit PaaI, partial [Acidobacteria bacterium]|nr:phenylacetate-CoA oxygenase subunit PaaI [Acidobacteriota bacterium]
MASEAKKAVFEFEEGSPLPDEYKKLLIKMLEHEGERTGNKSFFQFLQSVLEVTESYAPDVEAKLIMADYVAEELKHCIMFQRIAIGLDKDLATRDTPFKHEAFHLPRESWADESFFHLFLDLNGAFHAGEWRKSSYLPLRRIAKTIEKDEFGHSEMGYRFLQDICNDPKGKEKVQRLLYKWYPAALDTFG